MYTCVKTIQTYKLFKLSDGYAQGTIDLYLWVLSTANFNFDKAVCVGHKVQVGSYPLGASPYGALDMAGNVVEWVNDWYSSSYYSDSPYANPLGPTTGNLRVIRGGAHIDLDFNLRVADRDKMYADERASSYPIGFWCASSP